MTAREQLAAHFAPELLAALDAHIEELAAQRLMTLLAESTRRRARWLSVAEAAQLEGCTPDAMRMRIKRGHYDSKRVGRTVRVSAASLNGGPVVNDRGEA